MLHSGKIVDLSEIKKPKIDKHSTGGVGDKVSIILAPQIAVSGIAVPMISGRGLGHTGGTLDKLESIPGFSVNWTIEEYKNILSETGLVMCGQTSELAPADKKIYAMRDVTATVECIPLITASIMSKKLAEGAEAIVFDITIGSGANMPDRAEARKLGEKLVSVSKQFGKKAIAILTDMDEPLGNKIGNWIEIEECIEVMNGKKISDLEKVNNVIAGAMMMLGGKAKTIEEGEAIAEEIISSGKAFEKFKEMVKRQGGDIAYVNDWKNLKRAKFREDVKAKTSGYISRMDALKIGLASVELGCGRKKVTDGIDYLAGIELFKKCGDEIKEGETVMTLFAEDEGKIKSAKAFAEESIEISNSKPKERKLIIEILY
jgi:pyrimidine-nucleoside phosphorylase